jgi:hypothetical protein
MPDITWADGERVGCDDTIIEVLHLPQERGLIYCNCLQEGSTAVHPALARGERTMFHSFCVMVFVLCASVCVAQQVVPVGQQSPQGEKQPPREPLCRFTAKVNWIEIVGKREVKAVPVGTQFKMNWLVGIDIISIEKAAKAFEKKGESVLLIHSPAIFFQTAEKVIGKQYLFEIFGEVKGGTPRYDYADVKEKKNPRKKSW